MWFGPETRRDAGTAKALRAHRYVVSQGVRHVPIDVLPRERLTFRTVCNLDVTEDDRSSGDSTDCLLCRRFEWP